MRRPDSPSGVPTKVFVERDVIAEIFILLEEWVESVHRANSIAVLEKDLCQPVRQFCRHLVDCDEVSRTRWALDLGGFWKCYDLAGGTTSRPSAAGTYGTIDARW